MPNGELDFRFRGGQFPIAAVLQATQQKALIEAQLEQQESQERQQLFSSILQAAQVGSQLASQAVQRSTAKEQLDQLRQKRQDIQELADLSMRTQGATIGTQAGLVPSPGPVQQFAQPQLTPQQFQQQAAPAATRLQPEFAAQQILKPTPTIGPAVSAQAGRAGIQVPPTVTQPQFQAAAKARELELKARPPITAPPKIPAELLKQEVELKSTLADIGTIEQELQALPAGIIKGGKASLAATLTGGFSNPQVKVYNDNLNQRAVRFYRATTKDTRLSDFDARKSALPMMPKLTDTRATQTLKIQALKLTAQENLSLVEQAQRKARNPNEVIRVQKIARNRLKQRGLLIDRLAKFNAKNPDKAVPLTMDSILQLEQNLGLR